MAQTTSAPTVGNGSPDNPWEIATLENLYWIAASDAEVPDPPRLTRWNAYYLQTAHIDASGTSSWNGGAGWSPIGIFLDMGSPENLPFSGSYNGNGHIITGLFINGSQNRVGLFGHLGFMGKIENLGVENVNVTGNQFVGALAGFSEGAINYCYSTGSVTGQFYTGGHTGGNLGQINNGYSLVHTSGFDQTGGLVGVNYSQISNSYSMGSVTGTSFTGGLTGDNSGTISNSFWDTETSGQATSAGGTGKTTEEMKLRSTFTNDGWVFKDNPDFLWNIGNARNNGYPYLNWQYPDDPVIGTASLTTTEISEITHVSANSGGTIAENDNGLSVFNRGVCWSTSQNPTLDDEHTENGSGAGSFIAEISGLTASTTYYVRAYATNTAGTSYGEQYSFTTTFNGSGTFEDPYQISNLDELKRLSEDESLWDKHFIQTAHIDASATSTWNGGTGWSPIGNFSSNFSGSYDGQGHSISSLYSNRTGMDYQGLFGIVGNMGRVENLGVVNVDVTGNQFVGALAGLNQGIVTNSFSTGTLTGSFYAGGLVGQNSSIISNCYSTVHVTGFYYVGGFVGHNYNTISNCYSAGMVNGNSQTGGFAGDNGYMISNCFWDTETSGQATSAGGTDKTTAEMKLRSTFTGAGWVFKDQFEYIWNIGNDRNNGYPYLNGQYPDDPVIGLAEPSTAEISSTTDNSAISGGTITNNANGQSVLYRGVCWSISPNPTLYDAYTENGSGAGTFVAEISGLTHSITYYVRAYATNAAGTSYGNQVSFTIPLFNGSGTAEDPYQITNLNDLRKLSENDPFWNKHFIQTANIDASPTSGWDFGAGWLPIGHVVKNFTGTYNGDGHTISGLYINRPGTELQSFFRILGSGGKVENLGLVDLQMTGSRSCGGFAGDNYGTISNCFSSGNVSGNETTGGLAGQNNGTISNSYSTVSVSGNFYAGGLVGDNQGTISNSYSTGSVTGSMNVGGLAGGNGGTVSNSFWDTETSGQTTSEGGTDKTTFEMK
ncbi:MAG TPA: GLUG motif-containing protein, partial [Prolixibacteraceae bacterium]|nr:GLUG motif-containing protein [Prolixibacteraceae bacterium]